MEILSRLVGLVNASWIWCAYFVLIHSNCSAVFLSISAFFGLFVMGEPPAILAPKQTTYYFKYTNIPGYFLQDDPATDGSKFDYACLKIYRTVAMR